MSTTPLLTRNLAAEAGRLARFSVVGVGATLIHLAGAELAVLWKVAPWLAFLLGFLPAFLFSYLGHRHFTFGQGSRGSLIKFLIVALTGLAVGEGVLRLTQPHMHAHLGILVSVVAMPLATYVAARAWAFKPAT
jgi:putative flippase GtrA